MSSPSEEARFPEAVVLVPKRVGAPSPYDNMIQQRDIHRRSRFAQLPRELNVRSAGTWVT